MLSGRLGATLFCTSLGAGMLVKCSLLILGECVYTGPHCHDWFTYVCTCIGLQRYYVLFRPLTLCL